MQTTQKTVGRKAPAVPEAAVQQARTVKRAVIMAAGKGERLRPLTLRTPKPLIRVHGERMIDTVVKALHANGIFEICVVVGYRKEAFSGLPAEYPGLRLIENPGWERCNNISSLYAAREYLSDCIILDGDQLIRNPAVLAPEFTRSGYNAVWTEAETAEWLLTVEDRNTGALFTPSPGRYGNRGTDAAVSTAAIAETAITSHLSRAGADPVITRCSRTGGRDGWQLYSISRWTAEDGARLRRHLELEFEAHHNTSVYWDDVPLFCHPEEYELGIFPMEKGDVTEIDTLAELAAEDPDAVADAVNGTGEGDP